MTTPRDVAMAAVDNYATGEYSQGINDQKAADQATIAGLQQQVADLQTKLAALPAPRAQVEPSGLYPVVLYSNLYRAGDVDFNATVSHLTAPSCLVMDRPGVFECSDFAQASWNRLVNGRRRQGGWGIYSPNLPEVVADFLDPEMVTFRMKPGSSTRSEPALTDSNSYSVVRLKRAGNFTLEGTNQGHDHNGLQFYGATSDLGGNLRISGMQGSGNTPPRETFGINIFQCHGTAGALVELRDVDISPVRRSDGARVGTSPVGWNSSSFVRVIDANCHNALAGMPTFWRSTDCETVRLRSAYNGSGTGSLNGKGINHEESTRITHYQPTLLVDQPGLNIQHLQAASQHFDCQITVVDPTFDHPAYIGGQQLAVMIPATYGTGQKVTGQLITVTTAGQPVPVKTFH